MATRGRPRARPKRRWLQLLRTGLRPGICQTWTSAASGGAPPLRGAGARPWRSGGQAPGGGRVHPGHGVGAHRLTGCAARVPSHCDCVVREGAVAMEEKNDSILQSQSIVSGPERHFSVQCSEQSQRNLHHDSFLGIGADRWTGSKKSRMDALRMPWGGVCFLPEERSQRIVPIEKKKKGLLVASS